MTKKYVGVIALSLLAAVALYALLGFLAVPYAAKNFLVSVVERDLSDADHGRRLATQSESNFMTKQAAAVDETCTNASAWRDHA